MVRVGDWVDVLPHERTVQLLDQDKACTTRVPGVESVLVTAVFDNGDVEVEVRCFEHQVVPAIVVQKIEGDEDDGRNDAE